MMQEVLNMSKIRDLRSARGWTQEELGRMLNVQKAAVSKYEKGIASPSNEVLKKMSSIFNVSTDYLLDNEVSTQAPVYHLAVDETKLINEYRALDSDNKHLIMSLIGRLNFGRNSETSPKETSDYIVVTGKPVITVSP